jgi:hypothetical protein
MCSKQEITYNSIDNNYHFYHLYFTRIVDEKLEI